MNAFTKQDRKKRILIYSSVPGWAYDNILKYLLAKFSSEYDLYFDYTVCHRYVSNSGFFNLLKEDVLNLARFIFRLITFQKTTRITLYSVFRHRVTFFWQKHFLHNNLVHTRNVLPYWKKYDLVILLGWYFDRSAKLQFRSSKIAKGIFTDGFPPAGGYDFKLGIETDSINSIDVFCEEYLSDVDALIAGSPSIAERYSQHVKNIHFCSAIREAEIFFEKSIRLKSRNELFVVGWTGEAKRKFKNFYTIIEPAVNILISRGYNISLKTQFSGSYDSLPAFYQDVDVVLIASEQDAGPSLFAEASLCGVPSISNKIGFPGYVIDQNVSGIIVDLHIDEYVSALDYLYSNREKLYEMSASVRKTYLSKLSDEKLEQGWRELFKSLNV